MDNNIHSLVSPLEPLHLTKVCFIILVQFLSLVEYGFARVKFNPIQTWQPWYHYQKLFGLLQLIGQRELSLDFIGFVTEGTIPAIFIYNSQQQPLLKNTIPLKHTWIKSKIHVKL